MNSNLQKIREIIIHPHSHFRWVLQWGRHVQGSSEIPLKRSGSDIPA